MISGFWSKESNSDFFFWGGGGGEEGGRGLGGTGA